MNMGYINYGGKETGNEFPFCITNSDGTYTSPCPYGSCQCYLKDPTGQPKLTKTCPWGPCPCKNNNGWTCDVDNTVGCRLPPPKNDYGIATCTPKRKQTLENQAEWNNLGPKLDKTGQKGILCNTIMLKKCASGSKNGCNWEDYKFCDPATGRMIDNPGPMTCIDAMSCIDICASARKSKKNKSKKNKSKKHSKHRKYQRKNLVINDSNKVNNIGRTLKGKQEGRNLV